MDIFKACANFSGPGKDILAVRQGEAVEVLEPAGERHRREWWAARRIRDNALGYIPSKYLEVTIYFAL